MNRGCVADRCSFSDQMLEFFISFDVATRSRNFDCDPEFQEITLRSAASTLLGRASLATAGCEALGTM